MKRKPGRPYAKNPKDYRITIRLDSKQAERLLAYAQKYNINRNEAIRRAIEKLPSN